MFSPLSWNALQFIALLLWGNRTLFFLYIINRTKHMIPWKYEIYFSCWTRYLIALLIRESCSSSISCCKSSTSAATLNDLLTKMLFQIMHVHLHPSRKYTSPFPKILLFARANHLAKIIMKMSCHASITKGITVCYSSLIANSEKRFCNPQPSDH